MTFVLFVPLHAISRFLALYVSVCVSMCVWRKSEKENEVEKSWRVGCHTRLLSLNLAPTNNQPHAASMAPASFQSNRKIEK